jgi:hypothetical protein
MPETPDVRQVLVRCLHAGQAGCVSATTADDVGLAVYVMFGEILAAHSSEDDAVILRILQNDGLVDAAQAEQLKGRAAAGESLSEAVFEVVENQRVLDVLAARFRENLFQFLGVTTPASFQSMDSVFVENIQVGHDSRQLLAELAERRAAVMPLLAQPALRLAPGKHVPVGAVEPRVVAMCTDGLAVRELLAKAPWEASEVLAIVVGMLESGRLVAGGDSKRAPVVPLPDVLRTDEFPALRSEPRKSTPASAAPAPAAAARKPPPVAPLDVPAKSKPAPETLRPQRTLESSRTQEVSETAPSPGRLDASTLDISKGLAGAFESLSHDELDLFSDNERRRGDGSFTVESSLLDKVELFDDNAKKKKKKVAPAPPSSGQDILVEMEDAEAASRDALAGAVALNFAGPRLAEDEARRKLEVCNEVLNGLALAIDAQQGAGMGQARVQILVEGTPAAFAPIFKNVEIDESGCLPVDLVLKNLRRRPASEHRRLLKTGLGDLIERALSLAAEELDEAGIEGLLERIAGYQQRLGL